MERAGTSDRTQEVTSGDGGSSAAPALEAPFERRSWAGPTEKQQWPSGRRRKSGSAKRFPGPPMRSPGRRPRS